MYKIQRIFSSLLAANVPLVIVVIIIALLLITTTTSSAAPVPFPIAPGALRATVPQDARSSGDLKLTTDSYITGVTLEELAVGSIAPGVTLEIYNCTLLSVELILRRVNGGTLIFRDNVVSAFRLNAGHVLHGGQIVISDNKFVPFQELLPTIPGSTLNISAAVELAFPGSRLHPAITQFCILQTVMDDPHLTPPPGRPQNSIRIVRNTWTKFTASYALAPNARGKGDAPIQAVYFMHYSTHNLYEFRFEDNTVLNVVNIPRILHFEGNDMRNMQVLSISRNKFLNFSNASGDAVSICFRNVSGVDSAYIDNNVLVEANDSQLSQNLLIVSTCASSEIEINSNREIQASVSIRSVISMCNNSLSIIRGIGVVLQFHEYVIAEGTHEMRVDNNHVVFRANDYKGAMPADAYADFIAAGIQITGGAVLRFVRRISVSGNVARNGLCGRSIMFNIPVTSTVSYYFQRIEDIDLIEVSHNTVTIEPGAISKRYRNYYCGDMAAIYFRIKKVIRLNRFLIFNNTVNLTDAVNPAGVSGKIYHESTDLGAFDIFGNNIWIRATDIFAPVIGVEADDSYCAGIDLDITSLVQSRDFPTSSAGRAGLTSLITVARNRAVMYGAELIRQSALHFTADNTTVGPGSLLCEGNHFEMHGGRASDIRTLLSVAILTFTQNNVAFKNVTMRSNFMWLDKPLSCPAAGCAALLMIAGDIRSAGEYRVENNTMVSEISAATEAWTGGVQITVMDIRNMSLPTLENLVLGFMPGALVNTRSVVVINNRFNATIPTDFRFFGITVAGIVGVGSLEVRGNVGMIKQLVSLADTSKNAASLSLGALFSLHRIYKRIYERGIPIAVKIQGSGFETNIGRIFIADNVIDVRGAVISLIDFGASNLRTPSIRTPNASTMYLPFADGPCSRSKRAGAVISNNTVLSCGGSEALAATPDLLRGMPMCSFVSFVGDGIPDDMRVCIADQQYSVANTAGAVFVAAVASHLSDPGVSAVYRLRLSFFNVNLSLHCGVGNVVSATQFNDPANDGESVDIAPCAAFSAFHETWLTRIAVDVVRSNISIFSTGRISRAAFIDARSWMAAESSVSVASSTLTWKTVIPISSSNNGNGNTVIVLANVSAVRAPRGTSINISGGTKLIVHRASSEQSVITSNVGAAVRFASMSSAAVQQQQSQQQISNQQQRRWFNITGDFSISDSHFSTFMYRLMQLDDSTSSSPSYTGGEVSCVYFNDVPLQRGNRFWAARNNDPDRKSFFDSTAILRNVDWQQCPRTLSLSLSQSVSEVPYCADFTFVADAASSRLVGDDVVGETRVARWYLLLDRSRDTPAPVGGGRIVPANSDDLLALKRGGGESMFLTVFKDNLPSLRVVNAGNESAAAITISSSVETPDVIVETPDIAVVDSTTAVASVVDVITSKVRNESLTARARLFTAALRFRSDIDVIEEQTVRLKISKHLLACKPRPGESQFAEATLRLLTRYSLLSASLEEGTALSGALSALVALPLPDGALVATTITRANALLAIFICTKSKVDRPLTFLESPLGLRIGTARGSYLKGAVVGNLVILAIVSFMIVLVGVARWFRQPARNSNKNNIKNSNTTSRSRMSNSRGSQRTARGQQSVSNNNSNNDIKKDDDNDKKWPQPPAEPYMTFLEAIGRSGFPSLVFVPLGALTQGTIKSIVGLFKFPGGEGFALVGSLFFIVWLLLMATVVFRLLPRQRLLQFRWKSIKERGSLPPLDPELLRKVLSVLFTTCKRCIRLAREFASDAHKQNREVRAQTRVVARRPSWHETVAQFLMSKYFFVSGVWFVAANVAEKYRAIELNRKLGNVTLGRRSGGGADVPPQVEQRATVTSMMVMAGAVTTSSSSGGSTNSSGGRNKNNNNSKNNNTNDRTTTGFRLRQRTNEPDNDRFFIERYGRFFSKSHDSASWCAFFNLVVGISIGIITGLQLYFFDCSQAMMFIVSVVVCASWIVVILVWPALRNTANVYSVITETIAFGMCVAGLVANLENDPKAYAILGLLLASVQVVSTIVMLVDLSFLTSLRLTPFVKVSVAVWKHWRTHRASSTDNIHDDDVDGSGILSVPLRQVMSSASTSSTTTATTRTRVTHREDSTVDHDDELRSHPPDGVGMRQQQPPRHRKSRARCWESNGLL